MMTKSLLARCFVTVLLTLGAVGVAGPAQADKASPQDAVEKFWNLVENGKGSRAYLAVQPSCRNQADRRALQKVSNQLDRIADKGGVSVSVDSYKENLNGRNARVSYVVKVSNGNRTKTAEKVKGQKWVRIDKRWFLACTQ